VRNIRSSLVLELALMSTTRLFVIFGIGLALVGCVTRPQVKMVNTEIATFHRLPASLAGMTFVMVPSAEQATSLEYSAYEAQVRQGLSAYGLVEAPVKSASIAVSFRYYIDTGKQVNISVPVWGQTGVSTSSTTGTVRDSGYYSATTNYMPSYGVTGYRNQAINVFTRRLDLVLFDAENRAGADQKPLYESHAVSTGSSGQLPVISPLMIESIFSEFPGRNGGVRRVSLPCVECQQ